MSEIIQCSRCQRGEPCAGNEYLSRETLLNKIKEIAQWTDREAAHSAVDDLLLEYIGDKEIIEAYKNQVLWCA